MIMRKVFIALDDSWGDADGLRVYKLPDEHIAELNTLEGEEALDYIRQHPRYLVIH